MSSEAAGAGAGAGAGGAASSAADAPPSDPLVQYIVVRKDLGASGWPLGAIMAQACHASSAALHVFGAAETTVAYLGDLDNMHKVVLGAKSEVQLRNLAQKLEDAGVGHKLWIEQPENYATSLATQPLPRSALQPYFKKFKLLS